MFFHVLLALKVVEENDRRRVRIQKKSVPKERARSCVDGESFFFCKALFARMVGVSYP